MWYVLSISVVTIILMIISIVLNWKIKIGKQKFQLYYIIVLLGALLLLAVQLINPAEILNVIFSNDSINPIKLLILFLSMTLISIFLDEVGFFSYLANQTAKRFKSNQTKLYLMLYLLISFLTIFTSNDIIILTFTPFICYFCKRANINPVPYLFSEFIAANTWSMFLSIGNPTNIFISSSFGITFVDYLKVMAIPTIVGGIVSTILCYFVFRKSLKEPISLNISDEKINDKFRLIAGLLSLIICIILLTLSSYIGVDMWLITLIALVGLLIAVLLNNIIRHKKFDIFASVFKKAPWQIVPFVLSMFIIVIALNKYEITKIICTALGEKNTVFSYGILSTLSANVFNNIPMSIFYTFIMQNMSTINLSAIYATIIGSNIGAFLTPLGALAGIMWLNILKENKIHFTFLKFIKYGVIIAIPTLLATLFTLLLFV